MAANHKREIELAWVAGIVDGEGCIDYTPTARQVKLRVAMTHQRTVRHVARLIGGRVQWEQRKNHKRLYTAALSKAAQLEYILTRIRPHSVTKAKEIDLVLRYLRSRKGRAHKRMTTRDKRRANRLYWTLRQLKKEA